MAGLNVGFVGEGIEGVMKAALRLLSKIGHQVLWVLLLQHGQQILQDSIHFTAFCKIQRHALLRYSLKRLVSLQRSVVKYTYAD